MKMFSIGTKHRLLAASAVMVAMLALTIGATAAFAQGSPNPGWQGPGQFCVDDTGVSPLNCTANDTRISKISPEITEVCLTAGDTATAQFTAYLVIGASTRYDMGMYVATGAPGTGNAETGSSCYKDVLQPVAALNAAGNPLNPLGVGPFKNEDGDLCGEANQGDPALSTGGAIYKLQQSVTITCNDANNDGVVDPISTCLSWANNGNQYACNAVSALVPGPGTGAKCNCEDTAPNPPILLYKGYDFGDLPQGVVAGSNCPTDFNYPTLDANGGPKHAIQDVDNNGIPNLQGAVPAIWLGTNVDHSPAPGETDGQPSFGADGDNVNDLNDETGVAFTAPWYTGANGGKATMLISADGAGACSVANPCHVAMWIDWNGDGTFTNTDFPAGERYTFDFTNGAGTKNVTFDTPVSDWGGCGNLYARVRLYDDVPATGYAPGGLALNGEVEDYNVGLSPTGVTLADFSAACVDGTPLLTWETVSELQNQGFNLYRGVDSSNPDTQLNATMIPSQGPGSAQGFMYTWPDDTAQPDTMYYYWLEDVDFAGATAMHGPISAMCSAPTAVTFSNLDAGSTSAGVLSGWMVALALGVMLAGFVAVRRMRTT
ncbi:MAG: hypothetical protein H6647_21675 [Anaerolineales bacterium]|nr:hypothetical protein [Anaerolineales bacterium]